MKLLQNNVSIYNGRGGVDKAQKEKKGASNGERKGAATNVHVPIN